jgi:hypothetical protein
MGHKTKNTPRSFLLRAYLAKGGDARAGSYRDSVTRLFLETADKL